MLLQPSWKMWFGPWAFKYLPRERLLSFPDAYLVEARANLVFIQLYERLEDFELPENRQRQQLFRAYMGIDKLVQQSSEIFRRDLEPLLTKEVAPEDQYFVIEPDGRKFAASCRQLVRIFDDIYEMESESNQ